MGFGLVWLIAFCFMVCDAFGGCSSVACTWLAGLSEVTFTQILACSCRILRRRRASSFLTMACLLVLVESGWQQLAWDEAVTIWPWTIFWVTRNISFVLGNWLGFGMRFFASAATSKRLAGDRTEDQKLTS
ncbi:uncharacterized protein B0H64DRAFT_243059 [Chaetomium fimeti]|uniref:Uncharacterized protein n=1 Tax=Chaetomium fimeti TaxID=1854472 RepID=A0AAE0LNR5_9PEZI|nr:hypothetical protein B0H64DRAFT_243059 [Chaetomium fimeti]